MKSTKNQQFKVINKLKGLRKGKNRAIKTKDSRTFECKQKEFLF